MAKQNTTKWSNALDKVAAEAEQEALQNGMVTADAKEHAACRVKAAEESISKAVVIGTDHLDHHVQSREALEIKRLVAEGTGSHRHIETPAFGSHEGGSGAAEAVECDATSQDGAKGLNVRAGKALSTMSSLSWVYSFVEFFYGDCLPMDPRRPSPLSFEQVFRYLLEREELEYALPGDEQPYKARPMSRWDSSEFVMLFASTLRSLNLLRVAKLSFLDGDKAKAFRSDLQALATAKAEDFQEILRHDKSKNCQSLVSLLQSPEVRQTKKCVYVALKNLLMQTATVPLTEGNKMKMRHQSFSMSYYFGSLKLFVTTNFADTYSPVLLQLYDLAGCESEDPTPDESSSDGNERKVQRETLIGDVRANIFADNPEMPTLEAMHKLVARHPTLQANLFLLMEKLVITELLCIHGAYIGKVKLESLDRAPSQYEVEDPPVSRP